MLKNNEITKSGFYYLTRTDESVFSKNVRVTEKDGEFYCEDDNVNPISSYDPECRWQFYFA
jgi:hypothetical protein